MGHGSCPLTSPPPLAPSPKNKRKNKKNFVHLEKKSYLCMSVIPSRHKAERPLTVGINDCITDYYN